jgi:probable phosphoglycerate mutase
MLVLNMVRHGQTDFSRENRFCGLIDPPLNDVGIRMAEALGKAYGEVPFRAIISSPSIRAVRTAQAVADRVGLPVETADGLREIAYGEWDGLRQDEVERQFPAEFHWWALDPASRGTPGGETAFAVAARAVPVVDRLRERCPDGNVLLVSHKATIRILTCALLGLDVRLFRERLAQPVASVTRFEIGPHRVRLVAIADESHLPSDLREQPGT